jgi:hypothetical protein
MEQLGGVDNNFFEILEKSSLWKHKKNYTILNNNDEQIRLLIKLNNCNVNARFRNEKFKYGYVQIYDHLDNIKIILEKINSIMKKKLNVMNGTPIFNSTLPLGLKGLMKFHQAPFPLGLSFSRLKISKIDKNICTKIITYLKEKNIDTTNYYLCEIMDRCVLSINLKSNVRYGITRYCLTHQIIDMGLPIEVHGNMNPSVRFTTDSIPNILKIRKKRKEINMVIEI